MVRFDDARVGRRFRFWGLVAVRGNPLSTPAAALPPRKHAGTDTRGVRTLTDMAHVRPRIYWIPAEHWSIPGLAFGGLLLYLALH